MSEIVAELQPEVGKVESRPARRGFARRLPTAGRHHRRLGHGLHDRGDGRFRAASGPRPGQPRRLLAGADRSAWWRRRSSPCSRGSAGSAIPVGIWAFYFWSAGDIALISVAIAATGGANSELWAVYALTTVFFAAVYPHRAQAALACGDRGVVHDRDPDRRRRHQCRDDAASACDSRAWSSSWRCSWPRNCAAEMERRSDATLRARISPKRRPGARSGSGPSCRTRATS